MTINIKNSKNIIELNNPLIHHYLSIIRNKNTDSFNFRHAIGIIGNLLSFTAIENLPLKNVQIETPVATANCKTIDTNIDIFIVPILRAGLGIANSLFDILPFAKMQHLGMYRNEKTLEPVWYYNKLPKTFKNPKNTFVYICDPMLATGGSITEAIKLYIEKGVPQENITTLNLICAPEGLNKISNKFPNIRIITACIDEKLNEKGYIVPGLGDAGDRIFNTLY